MEATAMGLATVSVFASQARQFWTIPILYLEMTLPIPDFFQFWNLLAHNCRVGFSNYK
jgi:hypothetical protein